MADAGEKQGGVSFTAISLSDGDSEAQAPEQTRHLQPIRQSRKLQTWTTVALMVSYFVFSIALYTLFNHAARKAFWFVYLSVATVTAAITALEAYDGLTPLREARKAIKKTDNADAKFKVAEDQLPTLHLIIDAYDAESAEEIDDVACFCNDIAYPDDRVVTTILQGQTNGESTPSLEYVGEPVPEAVRLLSVPASATATLSSRVAYCLLIDPNASSSTLTAVLRSSGRPHPHSVRHAVEKLAQEAKIDVVQGRNVQATNGTPIGGLASVQHDLTHGLLHPGRCLTWGLSVGGDVDSFWKTDVLRAAATAGALHSTEGLDLPYSALAQNARTVYDLRVISYSPCPDSWTGYWSQRVSSARQMAVASIRHTSLAFKRYRPAEGESNLRWSVKTRVALLYQLLLSRLAAHAVLQYFSMALALLFTRTPHSAADVARLIYFPYPVSVWFVCIG
jgi:hypothetical protein